MGKKKNRTRAVRQNNRKKKEGSNTTATAAQTARALAPARGTTAERKRALSADAIATSKACGNKSGVKDPELEKALKFPIIEPWIAQLSRPWSRWPHIPPGKQHGVGLKNLGNDCFLNSVMQTVVHTPQLARMVIDPATNTTSVCTRTADCFHCALRSHILQAVVSAKCPFVAEHIRLQLPRIFPRHVGGRQEDAHEMLALLLDALDPPLPKVKSAEGGKGKTQPDDEYSTPIQQIFGGTLRNKVTCSECGHEHVNFERIQEMSVALPRNGQTYDIDRLVKGFFAGETIPSFKCDKCGRKTNVRRETQLLRGPSVLIVYLKRFMPNASGRGYCKNSVSVRPQLKLSLNAYTWSEDGGAKTSDESTSADYELNGIVTHLGGGMHSGHYTCKQRGFDGKSWFHFNDSWVSTSNEEHVLEHTDPYILVYVKKKPARTKSTSRPASV